VAKSLEEAQEKAKLKFQRAVTLQQDEDVLDTWFRYGLS
jgi:valyl-tRNA synthetase